MNELHTKGPSLSGWQPAKQKEIPCCEIQMLFIIIIAVIMMMMIIATTNTKTNTTRQTLRQLTQHPVSSVLCSALLQTSMDIQSAAYCVLH
jgi:hypothetical protein